MYVIPLLSLFITIRVTIACGVRMSQGYRHRNVPRVTLYRHCASEVGEQNKGLLSFIVYSVDRNYLTTVIFHGIIHTYM
jgi:hypothetical protein